MKKIRTIILGLVLVFAMNTVALADIDINIDGLLDDIFGGDDTYVSELISDKTVIYDGADILDESEEKLLFKDAEKVSKKHDINIIIYTEEEYIYDSRNAAEEIYLAHFEEYTDGIIYYVNMRTRDYYFATSGDVKKSLSDNYGLKKVEDKVVDNLSDGFYYSSFDSFLELVDKFEKEAKFGLPYCFLNPYRTFGEVLIRIIIAIIVGIVVANIRTGSQKSKLKTVKAEALARSYVPKDGFNLSVNKDTFLFKNVTRTAIPKSSSSSGGSGRSGGGGGRSSFGGRGGKF